MMRTQISTSISTETRRQIEKLSSRYGTIRDVVTVAIDRLYQQEAPMNQRLVHLFWHPEIDNRWIARTSDNEWVQFPPNAGEFAQREPYTGPLTELRPIHFGEAQAMQLAGCEFDFVEGLNRPWVVPVEYPIT